MASEESKRSIRDMLSDAVSEVETIKHDIQTGAEQEYYWLSMDLEARHQLIMDATGEELYDVYVTTGDLSGVKLREINMNADDYSLSYRGVMDILDSLKQTK